MKVWNKGDRVQVRDRRDNTIVDVGTVRSQEDTTLPVLEGDKVVEKPHTVVYITMDTMGAIGIPHACVEEVGQKERNP